MARGVARETWCLPAREQGHCFGEGRGRRQLASGSMRQQGRAEQVLRCSLDAV